MSDRLQTLAAYVPPGLLMRALAEPGPDTTETGYRECQSAAVLFADISGFTPLAEALANRGAEGPEELTRLLNVYFGWMIAFIEAEGGEVVQFGGDALTVVFPAREQSLADAARRALQAAESMQMAMDDFNVLESSIGAVHLEMKIGIGVGELLELQIGGHYGWHYLLMGPALTEALHVQSAALPGQLIVSEAARAVMTPEPLPRRPLPRYNWALIANPAASETFLRNFVPHTVLSWLDENLGDWLAVLRPMSVLFVGIDGLNKQPEAVVYALNDFIRAAQERIAFYQGSINKLAVDDKGTSLLVLFGAPPLAHENDAERAILCAMDLQTLAHRQTLQLRIGVTTGRVFAGPVGSDTRREYTVMGDAVNLAARLMETTPPGEIICSFNTYRRTHRHLAFVELPPSRVKGKTERVARYRPTGERLSKQLPRTGLLAGRHTEATYLQTLLHQTQKGQSQILNIEGEAGIGKSRLVGTLLEQAEALNLAVCLGTGQTIAQDTPFGAWRSVFETCLGLSPNLDQATRTRQVADYLQTHHPDIYPQRSRLNILLDLNFAATGPEDAVALQADPDDLQTLLLQLFQQYIAQKPTLLILDDAQWLDEDSWKLCLALAQSLPALAKPLLFIIVSRPLDGASMRIEPVVLRDLPYFQRLWVDSLPPEAGVALITNQLQTDPTRLSEPLLDFMHERGGGNPFFIQELLYVLQEQGRLMLQGRRQHPVRWQLQGDLNELATLVPDAIEAVILARIDRLPLEEQLVLKAAAVIGQAFSYTILRDVLQTYTSVSERFLRVHLDDLAHINLTPRLNQNPEPVYRFKHGIIREVAYQTLLFAQRRTLHQAVALWHEKQDTPPHDLLAYYKLLSYHWRQADEPPREQHYTRLGGLMAIEQQQYTEALLYLSRAIELTPHWEPRARAELLLAREDVHHHLGNRMAQALDLAELGSLEVPQYKHVLTRRRERFAASD